MFTEADKRHLEATEGWLGLRNWREAELELECVATEMREHPDVLRLRWEICREAKQWERAVEIGRAIAQILPGHPYGWIHYAFALHEMKRTAEALAVVLPVVDRFPDDYILPYNLACYECQLGNLTGAMKWLETASARGGKPVIRKMALQDHDLEPLWEKISE